MTHRKRFTRTSTSKWGAGDKVLLTTPSRLAIMQIKGIPTDNGFTWMYAFEGTDLRCGEMYLSAVDPSSPLGELVQFVSTRDLDPEHLTKLQYVVDNIKDCVNFDFLDVFVSVVDKHFKPMGCITELSSSDGRHQLTLTNELVDRLHADTIRDQKARAHAHRK